MSNVKTTNICVVGAGIIAISSAYGLAVNYPGCSITIIADKWSPDTVSHHSFGSIWIPNALKGYSGTEDDKRILSTYSRCVNITSKFPDLAKEMGFEINTGFHVFDRKVGVTEKESPIFMNTSKNFKQADPAALNAEEFISESRLGNFEKIFKRSDVCVDDLITYTYEIAMIDCDRYIPWMVREMKLMVAKCHINGLELKHAKIESLEELCGKGYDIIINCTGFGAKRLCNDDRMLPIRGQYLECKRPHKSSPFYGSMTTVLFPIAEKVLVGSIFQDGREDTDTDDRDTEDILERAKAFWPDIEEHVINVITEIRPGRRNGSRLEVEMLQSNTPGVKPVPIIHNYGHGPKGIMLHWGCAQDVLDLSRQFLKISKL